MEQRTDDGLSPYRTYTRAEWAALRDDMPMTLTQDEVSRLRSLHDRLDMKEVEEIYLPVSRLLSLYVAATQRLFIVQQHFLGTAEAKVPYIIGVAGSVAVGKSTTARVLQALLARWPNAQRSRRNHSFRSATSCTRWLSSFLRIRCARRRVGRMFSRRLIRLMRSQIDVAVSIACLSSSFE